MLMGRQLDSDEAARNEDACLLLLDDALTALARLDARKRAIVEMRFFLGMSVEETAETLELTPDATSRELRLAQAWLRREIQRRRPGAPPGVTSAARLATGP